MKFFKIKLLSIVLSFALIFSPTAVFADFTVRVVYDDLIIREGPGTNYAVSRKYPGTYTGVGIFTITEVQPGPGATKGWGRLKSGAGWVSMDWVEKTVAESGNSNNTANTGDDYLNQLRAERAKKRAAAARVNNNNETKELEEKLKEYEIRLKELQDKIFVLESESQTKKDALIKIIKELNKNTDIENQNK